MKIKTFSPHLAPNEQPDLDSIDYSRGYYASTKLDGCRLLFNNGVTSTRSLKPLQNKQLNDKFEPLRKYSGVCSILMDGEIYAEGIPFQFIVSCFMTQDYTAKKSIKAWQKLCDEHEVDFTREEVLNKLKFYMFDSVVGDYYLQSFKDRTFKVKAVATLFPNLIVPVEQKIVKSADEVRAMFKEVLQHGYEGLMLKSVDCGYKFGRSTLKEGTVYKVKPYVTTDAQIIGFTQATVVDPNAAKTVNELGRSVTSKKKSDRLPINRVKNFIVNYYEICRKCVDSNCVYGGCKCDGQGNIIAGQLEVGIGGTDTERDEIWANKESYIGRWIEYKYLDVGIKDAPRSANMTRFREDKD